MAYLRKHRSSPYWLLRRRDDSGRWVETSTKLRHADPAETRRAQRLAEKASTHEAMLPRRAAAVAAWASWVPRLIADHCAKSSTRKRAECSWQRIAEFCRERKLTHPAQVTPDLAEAYVAWRKAAGAAQNTARTEVKFWAFLLGHAARCGLCDRNPFDGIRIGRGDVRQKPDLSPAQIDAARKAFAVQPEWMRTTFEIMLYTGCRFAEASILLSDIDFERNTLFIDDAKRDADDPRKKFAVPIHPGLRPTLLACRGQDRTVPLLRENWRFNRILRAATGGATSHSLRVAFVSRCHRAGLSEAQTMALVNHSSRIVHRIYSRLSGIDAAAAMARLPEI